MARCCVIRVLNLCVGVKERGYCCGRLAGQAVCLATEGTDEHEVKGMREPVSALCAVTETESQQDIAKD